MDVAYSVVEALAKQIRALYEWVGLGGGGGGGGGWQPSPGTPMPPGNTIVEQISNMWQLVQQIQQQIADTGPIWQELRALRVGLDTLNGNLGTTNANVTALATRVSATETKNTEQDAAIATLNASVAPIPGLVADVTQLRADMTTVTGQVSLNKQAIDEIRTLANRNTSDIATLGAYVNKNTADIATLTERLDNLVKPPEEGGSGVITAEQFNDLAARVTANTTNIATNVSSIAALDGRVTALENISKDPDGNLVDLRPTINQLIQGLQTVGTTVNTNTSDIANMKDEMNSMNATLSQLKDLEPLVNNMQAAITDNKNRLDTLEPLIPPIQVDVGNNKAEIAALKTRVDALEQGGTGGGGLDDSQIQALQAELQNNRATDAQQTSDLNELQNAVNSLQEALSQTNGTLETLQRGFNNLTSWVDYPSGANAPWSLKGSGGSTTVDQTLIAALDQYYPRRTSRWFINVSTVLATLQRNCSYCFRLTQEFPVAGESVVRQSRTYSGGEGDLITILPASASQTLTDSGNWTVAFRKNDINNWMASLRFVINSTTFSGARTMNLFYMGAATDSPWYPSRLGVSVVSGSVPDVGV